jgi:hypothetical protein
MLYIVDYYSFISWCLRVFKTFDAEVLDNITSILLNRPASLLDSIAFCRDINLKLQKTNCQIRKKREEQLGSEKRSWMTYADLQKDSKRYNVKILKVLIFFSSKISIVT